VTEQEAARTRLGRWVDGLLVVFALGLLVYLTYGRESGPSEQAKATSFDLPLLGSAGRFRFDGPRERPLLVEAFASWCGACRRSAPTIDGLRDAVESGQLDILLVSVDESASAARSARRSWPIVLPVAFDERGTFQRAYHISVLPTFVLIGTDGRVLDVSSGPPGGHTIRKWLRAGDD